MRWIKTRIWSILLTLALLLPVIPAPALAAGAQDAPSSRSSAALYDIGIRFSPHGKVTVSSPSHAYLDTVTLTVVPDDGYRLEQLSAATASGQQLQLSKAGENRYTFSMPSSAVVVEASFLPLPSTTQPTVYSDVDSSAWYADAAYYVTDLGIMTGTGTNTFSPDEPVTRAMLAQMLYSLEGEPDSAPINFGDVTFRDWYCDAVAWVSEKWIMTGYYEGRFIPENPVTREQLALVFFNYAKFHDYNTRAAADLYTYSDGGYISTWAREAMIWAVGAGIISGQDGNRLDPSGNATRGEVAQMFMRFCETVAK